MAYKKRILHLIQSLESGGCENMLLRTLPLLTDFEHHIITLKKLGELAPQFSEHGITITCVHLQSFWNIRGYWRLLKEIRAWEPDLVLTYLFHADAIGRLFLRRKLKVPILPFLRTTYNDSRYLIARLFERWSAPWVRHYLANSNAVKKFYVEHSHIQESKITVIENGIDLQVFENASPNESLKKELGIPPGDIILISVANLHPNKGHRYLLEAFEQVYKEHKNIHLLLVGDGLERGQLITQTNSLVSKDRIHFLGKRPDVPRLLRMSHIFVLPTLFEGMSNAILEAMAARLVVITTNIPENREILENGKSGLLVKTADAGELGSVLERLLENPLEGRELAQKAQETVRRRFSLPGIAEKWKDYLTSMTSSTL